MNKFVHKKSLGQNFLRDENVLNKIKNSVLVDSDDLIIEIGPGQGALTKKLKEFNANLLCFEIDERTKPDLQALEDSKTKIIFEDFLKTDIINQIKDIKYKNLYIVANLPYYITTPIIEKITELKLPVKEMVLMVQKEVADRFGSVPGNKSYGSITVYLNYYYDIEKLFIVNRDSFNPAPNVDSMVIKFKEKKNRINVTSEEHFFTLVRNAFKQKRKTIKNNLFDYDLKIVERVLLEHNLNLQSRAEQIDVTIFAEISNQLVGQK